MRRAPTPSRPIGQHARDGDRPRGRSPFRAPAPTLRPMETRRRLAHRAQRAAPGRRPGGRVEERRHQAHGGRPHGRLAVHHHQRPGRRRRRASPPTSSARSASRWSSTGPPSPSPPPPSPPRGSRSSSPASTGSRSSCSGPLLHRAHEAFVPLVGGDRIGRRPVDFHVERPPADGRRGGGAAAGDHRADGGPAPRHPDHAARTRRSAPPRRCSSPPCWPRAAP